MHTIFSVLHTFYYMNEESHVTTLMLNAIYYNKHHNYCKACSGKAYIAISIGAKSFEIYMHN